METVNALRPLVVFVGGALSWMFGRILNATLPSNLV